MSEQRRSTRRVMTTLDHYEDASGLAVELGRADPDDPGEREAAVKTDGDRLIDAFYDRTHRELMAAVERKTPASPDPPVDGLPAAPVEDRATTYPHVHPLDHARRSGDPRSQRPPAPARGEDPS